MLEESTIRTCASPKIKRFQVTKVTSVWSIKVRIRYGADNEEPPKVQTLIVKIQEWYIRDNIAQNLCKKLLLYFCTFQVTSEGLQSTRTILKIYQKECLAAILKVRIYYPRNMKFTSSTFIFRGGLLGNKWFCRDLTVLPRVQDSTDCARTCRQYKFLPTVIILLSAQSFYR